MINFESPCVSLCELDKSGKYCLGCKRTDKEVFSWMSYSEEQRKQIIKEVETRQFNENGKIQR